MSIRSPFDLLSNMNVTFRDSCSTTLIVRFAIISYLRMKLRKETLLAAEMRIEANLRSFSWTIHFPLSCEIFSKVWVPKSADHNAQTQHHRINEHEPIPGNSFQFSEEIRDNEPFSIDSRQAGRREETKQPFCNSSGQDTGGGVRSIPTVVSTNPKANIHGRWSKDI
jgi:hypothetical protein